MILYHGSFTKISSPDLLHSRANVDFGKGFYVTPIFEQAEKWSYKFKRRGQEGIVSMYEYFEDTTLKILRFDSYSEAWLSFILNCRSGNDTSVYDLVVGGVANDKAEALKRLRFEQPNLQMCFRTERALSCLRFLRSEKV